METSADNIRLSGWLTELHLTGELNSFFPSVRVVCVRSGSLNVLFPLRASAALCQFTFYPLPVDRGTVALSADIFQTKEGEATQAARPRQVAFFFFKRSGKASSVYQHQLHPSGTGSLLTLLWASLPFLPSLLAPPTPVCPAGIHLHTWGFRWKSQIFRLQHAKIFKPAAHSVNPEWRNSVYFHGKLLNLVKVKRLWLTMRMLMMKKKMTKMMMILISCLRQWQRWEITRLRGFDRWSFSAFPRKTTKCVTVSAMTLLSEGVCV